MTTMTRNQRQGALAELDVAMQLVKSGCAVNALTMDFGTDLHVQLPAVKPSRGADSWPMSQHDARVQVKSTRRSKPSFTVDRELVASWAPTVRKSSPVFLVICWVSGTRTRGVYLFTPEDFAGEGDSDAASVTFTGSDSTRVTSAQLLERVSLWARLAPRADALHDAGLKVPSLFGPLDENHALDFIWASVMAWMEAHITTDDIDHGNGYSEMTSLAWSMGDGLGLSGGQLEWEQRVAKWLGNATRYRGDWGDHGYGIAAFTDEREKESARDALIDLAETWGGPRRQKAGGGA